MARLVLPQFKQVDASGNEVDRSLDLEDIDDAFSRVAKTVNGNLGPGNIANGMRLASHVTAGAIPNAWRESASVVTFFAQGVGYYGAGTATPDRFVLASIPAAGTWIPLNLMVLAAYGGTTPVPAPRVTVFAPDYSIVNQREMEPVEAKLSENRYGVVKDYPNTIPAKDFSAVKSGHLFRLYLENVGADKPYGIPNGQSIIVQFDQVVRLSSASLSCLTPHLS